MDFWVYSEVKGKAICLVHGEQIAVFKDYSLNCHYNTKHSDTIQYKYKNLPCFTHPEREHPIPTLWFPQKLQSKPFYEGEFIKERLVDTNGANMPCEKRSIWERAPLQVKQQQDGSRTLQEIWCFSCTFGGGWDWTWWHRLPGSSAKVTC